MNDAIAVYLMFGLLIGQFICFFMSVGYALSSMETKNPIAAWKSNIYGGGGFLFMTVLSLVVQCFLENGADWRLWFASLTAAGFATLCFWLGFSRRRLHRSRSHV